MSDSISPVLVGHHEEHASAIADGILTASVEFDWGALEAVSELPQDDSERLAEAFHAILLWLVDRRFAVASVETVIMRKAIAATGLRAVVLALCLAPELLGNRQLREIAREAGVDEAYIRRLAGQIHKRWGVQHPFACSKSASPTD